MTNTVLCVCSIGADDDLPCACARMRPDFKESDYMSPSELDTTDYSATPKEKFWYAVTISGVVLVLSVWLALALR